MDAERIRRSNPPRLQSSHLKCCFSIDNIIEYYVDHLDINYFVQVARILYVISKYVNTDL